MVCYLFSVQDRRATDSQLHETEYKHDATHMELHMHSTFAQQQHHNNDNSPSIQYAWIMEGTECPYCCGEKRVLKGLDLVELGYPPTPPEGRN